MPRLIDAEKLTHYLAVNEEDKQFFYVKSKDIDRLPSIDPVHAAGGCYCWECKYRTKDTQWTRAGFCGRRDAGPMMIARPDDFCSRGKRRKEMEGE